MSSLIVRSSSRVSGGMSGAMSMTLVTAGGEFFTPKGEALLARVAA